MKNIIRRVLLAFSAFGFVALSGCAITPPVTETKNGAARLSTTVATPGVEGTSVTAAVLDFQEIDPKNGENAGVWKRQVHLYNNLPLGGELLKATFGAVLPSYIQGEAAKDVAKIGRCVGGNCGTVINAVSGSVSEAVNLNQIGVGVTTGVPSCGSACGADWTR